jgi:chemotaxis protein CheZ
MAKQSPAPIREADFAAIEAAVMETQRGRWFLAEYARRNRNADTEQVLGAIDKLDNSIRSAAPEKLAVVDDMVASLIDMGDAIQRTKREIFSLSGDGDSDHIGDASMELDAVVESTETATNQILSSAERIQESAFVAMERGEAPDELATIDAAVMEIYEGCSFQDITGQRISKVINTLRYIESRVTTMAEAWTQASGGGEQAPAASDPGYADPLLNGPAKPGEEMQQDEVDGLLHDTAHAMELIASDSAARSGESTDIEPIAAKADVEDGSVVDMPAKTAEHVAEIEKDDAWRGQNVPVLSASTTAIGSQAALEDLPTLTATEIDALYS